MTEMTVKQLIEELQKLEPDLVVRADDTGEVLVKVHVDKNPFSGTEYVWLEFKDL